MISIGINKKDLKELTRTDVRNLPDTLFAVSSPLLKPFMSKFCSLIPLDNKGYGDGYILSALHSHIDGVHADENSIQVRSDDKIVQIDRKELETMIGEKYPTTDHRRLNLPGLMFLQSSPALQIASVIKLRKEHMLHIPEGRRTFRYIFHMGVVSIDADIEKIIINFDPERLPKRADGSCVLK